jgi:hypothetical protein
MNLDELVGLTEQAAVAKINTAGYLVRVKARDNEPIFGDCSARRNRINLWIEKGLVTKVSFG